MQAAPLRQTTVRPWSTDQLVDTQLWTYASGSRGDYKTLLRSIDHSLRYLGTDSAVKAYQNYALPDFTRDRVIRSLRRFRELVRLAKTPQDLAQRVQQEFVLYESVGKDGQGRVEFTAYFEPTYSASRIRTSTYRYPLYRAPRDLSSWPQPHPTRATLEGKDGLGGKLRGNELVWLKDRLEAYLVQVQGSARLQLTDGSTMSIGFDGKTNYDYVSLGKELIQDGRFKADELSLPKLIQYFTENPQQLDSYIPRNNRFIFFRETNGAPATGSLGVPVSAERSIATDKSLMPPGALALVQTKLPVYTAPGQIEFQPISRFVLDQDTGSAIKGPGRVDIFMGTGEPARTRAGLVNHVGKLYYLLLKQ
ncbi:MltA domain-containing protein [Lyngbya confervoides BDU141951]|uniref:peptidoglycan lytic exotransglycosylase n=1 Tax=Lyngbya confervoides BDU141951 TaxID=1574623 RepID=A0ABD4T5U7_9CYAN|nr:MltA domain-containing protein [Lyngbya confervoides]MCM1983930.1 MltA domain-containing protein [Lyngbya confervoides BDU141951]